MSRIKVFIGRLGGTIALTASPKRPPLSPRAISHQRPRQFFWIRERPVKVGHPRIRESSYQSARYRIRQMACDGLEHESDAHIIGHELFKLHHTIKALSSKIHPMNVEDEIASAQRQFDRRIEHIKESARLASRAEEAVAELELL